MRGLCHDKKIIPDMEIEQGDFSGKSQTYSTSDQDREGVEDTTVFSNRSNQPTAFSNCSNQRVPFADKPGIEQEINCPTATANDNSQIWQMPTPINLDSSGLSHATTMTNQNAHLHSTSPPRSFKSALVLFSTIRSNLNSGLSCMAHSLQEKVTVTSTPTVSRHAFALLAFEPVTSSNQNSPAKTALKATAEMQPSADISQNLGTQLIFQLIDVSISNKDERCVVPPNWRQMSTKVPSMTKLYPHSG
jgi:hypothetical protein